MATLKEVIEKLDEHIKNDRHHSDKFAKATVEALKAIEKQLVAIERKASGGPMIKVGGKSAGTPGPL